MNNSEEHIRIAKDFYDRIGRMDFKGACDCLDDHVEAVFPYSTKLSFQQGVSGRVTVQSILEKTVPFVAERVDFTYDNFYPGLDPEVLTMQFHSTGIRARGEGEYANVYVAILRFRDNKIVYFAEYFDSIRGMGGLEKIRNTPLRQ